MFIKSLFFCLCMKCFTRKFIIIRCGEIFCLNVWYYFLTRSLRFGILFLTALRLTVVPKPVILSILASHIQFLTSPLVSSFFLLESFFSFLDLIYQCLLSFQIKSASIKCINLSN